MKQWYAVYTKPRAEQKARYNLERQGFVAYLPLYLKRRRHARRTDTVASPLFPRYLFIEFDPERSSARPVRSTLGVLSLVTSGTDPIPVPIEIIEQVRARESIGGYVAVKPNYRNGDKVKITEGPLSGCIGLFECDDDDERVNLLLQLLGRQIKVQVPADITETYSS
jgi:transcriptional antiterminator RfaH